MAGRLPFNMQGHAGQNPLHDAQIRAALGLSQVDEAMYLQQQRELQRDFQLRQMLIQDQLTQQNRLDSIVVEQRLNDLREQLHEFPELQQHYSQLLLRDRLQREEAETSFLARAQLQQQQGELQRRAIAQNQTQQPTTAEKKTQDQGQKQNGPATHVQSATPGTLRDIAADSLAGNAVKRTELAKRVYAKPDDDLNPGKKRPRAGTEDSGDLERKKKKKESIGRKDAASSDNSVDDSLPEQSGKPSVQYLLHFATSLDGLHADSHQTAVEQAPNLGTLGDLIQAAETERQTDTAVSVLKDIKERVVWSDSEDEGNDSDLDRERALKKGDAIVLPNFSSVLPQLPIEPEVRFASSSKKSRKKHRSLLDDDSADAKSGSKSKSEKRDGRDAAQIKALEAEALDYPYPVDTWWPSVTDIRRERRGNNEIQDEDNFDDDDSKPESQFRVNLPRLRERFSNEVAPGLLEKLPHCRIHRSLMKKRKNPSAPELVYCFQVTELYPNDIMVCCSHCGTWRHAGCGGHHKPFSIREGIDTPFTAVCDRCHEEEKVIRDYPIARRRIDRQRSEQIRRGLCTSAAMRQASFSKHGGTYKWPLGSVSATHIGGHTRSVHHRHDKAEKQWMDMAQRLSKAQSSRPKERTRVRTKELERLLVSVEDAEGHTDRHNMMLFLLQDTLREHPSGFEKRRQNIFDPEEDHVPLDDSFQPCSDAKSQATGEVALISSGGQNGAGNDLGKEATKETEDDKPKPSSSANGSGGGSCLRKGCAQKPRFDSLFCSDSCGVAALEGDLLRTFQYTSDIHPSLLRH